MLIVSALTYLICFFLLWFGSGLIISVVDHLCHKLKLSPFAISFLVLGLFTSLPEFAVGLNSISQRKPEVFVGNLIGGIVLIFFLIIPLLAIFGKGIKLNHQLIDENLLFALVVLLGPGYMILDRQVNHLEALVLLVFYLLLAFFIQKENGFLADHSHSNFSFTPHSLVNVFKIFLGIFLVFFSSRVIVSQTIRFAEILHLPIFYVSLFVISVGTNLPEIAIAIRSVTLGKKDIAFGNYLGSAAANLLLFTIFTFLYPGPVLTSVSFTATFILLIFGFITFYFFTRSRKDISPKEGISLLFFFLAFIVIEFYG